MAGCVSCALSKWQSGVHQADFAERCDCHSVQGKIIATKQKFCLQCDDGTQLRYGKQDMRFDYKGKTLLVSAVSGWHCLDCADCELDRSEG